MDRSQEFVLLLLACPWRSAHESYAQKIVVDCTHKLKHNPDTQILLMKKSNSASAVHKQAIEATDIIYLWQ